MFSLKESQSLEFQNMLPYIGKGTLLISLNKDLEI